MPSQDPHRDTVVLTAIEPDGAGGSRFGEETIAYDATSGPLQVTRRRPATAVSFRWAPGDFDFDYHPAPRKRLVVVTEGTLEVTASDGEARRFRCGDLLEVRDTEGRGHRSRSADGAPVRSAFIALDADLRHDRLTALEGDAPDAAGAGIDYLHNREDTGGRSFCTPAHLPYLYGGPSGVVTPELPLVGISYAYAAADLDYEWHPAPRRQLVLVLSGGIAMTYGSGQQSQVTAGNFLVGEDTDGQGHISRAVDGAARFSIFAHLG